MGDGARDDGSWSRAFMASSGIGVGSARRREESPEWHEASGADLPRHRFAELAHHRDVEVREVLARRTDCPMAVLASLAHDARPAVRVAVAANGAANRAVLEHLASDRDLSVVKAVARNRATSPELRAQLATHRKPEIRRVVERFLAQEQAVAVGERDTAESALPPELRERGRAATEDVHAARRKEPRTLAPRPTVAGGRGRERGAAAADARPLAFRPDAPRPTAFLPERPRPAAS